MTIIIPAADPSFTQPFSSVSRIPSLLRTRREDLVRNSRLPVRLVLAVDLSRRLPGLAVIEECSANDDLVTEDLLVVVRVRGAIGAVIAVDGVA